MPTETLLERKVISSDRSASESARHCCRHKIIVPLLIYYKAQLNAMYSEKKRLSAWIIRLLSTAYKFD